MQTVENVVPNRDPALTLTLTLKPTLSQSNSVHYDYVAPYPHLSPLSHPYL